MRTLAQDAGLDLVEIVPNADPPVCRIMDFGKYKFELQKKANLAKKKQKQVEIKMKFRPGTDDGDFDVKMRTIRRFLEEGDKVKISLRFRGREAGAHRPLATRCSRGSPEVGEDGVVERRSRVEGRVMSMMSLAKKPGAGLIACSTPLTVCRRRPACRGKAEPLLVRPDGRGNLRATGIPQPNGYGSGKYRWQHWSPLAQPSGEGKTMPKMKSNRAAAKRFRKTGGG
ncbi:MAG: translation initiation factor IF-3 [Rhodanobacteraceae bacterium]|nr:translation initiation factor IF-3 [Rhodanobacteraceae bacterium]